MLNMNPAEILSRVIILVIAFTVHEFSHAWVAVRLGDETPRLNGRLTLNPLAHLDIMGSLLLLFAGFGWAKPVPVNPYAVAKRNPLGMMWVSLAGPVSNFILALIAAVPLRLGVGDLGFAGNKFVPSLTQFLFEFIIINLSLMLFNLLPIAPLDGEKIAIEVFPPAISRVMERISPYGSLILIAVIFVAPMLNINIIGWIISPVMVNLLQIMGLL